MQVVIPRCKTLLIIPNSLILSPSQFANFHSTPICYEKWKNKWKPDFKESRQPSKSYVKYATRQKRADSKKALKSLLSHYGDMGTTFQNDEKPWKMHGTDSCKTDISGNSNNSTKKGRRKSNFDRAEKIQNHRMRRNFRKRNFSEDDEDRPETIFEATFGDRSFTWSFNPRSGSSQHSTPRFDWRKTFYNANHDEEEWEANDLDSEDETFNVGSRTDRVVLGLPPIGPLKMQDVKNAFHLSALKWHPDKHQGPSQAEAEEKFKVCADAYKSLCSALSGV